MRKRRVGIYPGTFDPIHNGHADVIRRASQMVDELIVAVAINAGKSPLFDLDARVAMVQAEADAMKAGMAINGARITVMPFQGLLIALALEKEAQVIVRGLRAVSDFEYEIQMAAANKRLAEEVETIFLMASETTQFISSRFVKEIHALGGDVSSFVSRQVRKRLDHLRERAAG